MPLNKKDIRKLLNDGYTLIREGFVHKGGKEVPTIKRSQGEHEQWRKLEEFSSKAARRRKMDELLKDAKTIEY